MVQAIPLQLRGVIGIEIINPNHLLTTLQEAVNNSGTNKTCRTRDQNRTLQANSSSGR
ncbi:hypothetical protein NZK27_09865 [Synechococcus sp. FGCU-3]|nr:hypothetical protein [Synechococcus sp. FGCU3]